jgi:hypothetical protein
VQLVPDRGRRRRRLVAKRWPNFLHQDRMISYETTTPSQKRLDLPQAKAERRGTRGGGAGRARLHARRSLPPQSRHQYRLPCQ